MATDLAIVKDHPAHVLREVANQMSGKIPVIPEQEQEARTFHVASATLDSYEREHRVTFAALDNSALAEVRQSYKRVMVSDDFQVRVAAANDLIIAVNALLGLDDD